MSRKDIMLSLAGLSPLLLLTLLLRIASATVFLYTNTNGNFTFGDIEATFTPRINSSGIFGGIEEANPSDGCSDLSSSPPRPPRGNLSIVLIEDGICSYTSKLQYAQVAGFDAVIVYNNQESFDYQIGSNSSLVEMSGNSEGIYIPAVYVSQDTGRTILSFVDEATCNFDNVSWFHNPTGTVTDSIPGNTPDSDTISDPDLGSSDNSSSRRTVLVFGLSWTGVVLSLVLAIVFRARLRHLAKILCPPLVPPQDELQASQPVSQLSTSRPPPDSIRPDHMLSEGDPEKQNAKDNNGRCVICWEAQVEVVCVPCGHLAGCMVCLEKIKSKGSGCPICRAPIQQVVKVHCLP